MPKHLITGFLEFKKEHYEGKDASMPRLVKEGQNPDYFLISCVDSRVDPAQIFNSPPGTFFSFRPMGAIVRPYVMGTALAAGLQFALEHNNVREVILLGHTGCGAIQALINELKDPDIQSFMDVARSGLEHAKHKCGDSCEPGALQRHAEEEIILQSARNLSAYPSVARAIERGQIEKVRPWIFDMSNGDLLEYNPKQETFEPIT